MTFKTPFKMTLKTAVKIAFNTVVKEDALRPYKFRPLMAFVSLMTLVEDEALTSVEEEEDIYRGGGFIDCP